MRLGWSIQDGEYTSPCGRFNAKRIHNNKWELRKNGTLEKGPVDGGYFESFKALVIEVSLGR